MTPINEAIFHRWLNREASPAELEQLKQDPAWQPYLQHLDHMADWQVPANLSAEEAWARLQARMDTPARVRPLRTWGWMAAAAAAIAILALFFWPKSATEPPQVYTTLAGEQSTVRLPDGSQVQLNGNSTLTVAGTYPDHRKVTLRGNAFFDVQKGRPFVVATETGKVQVLGTSFEVTEREIGLVVGCYEGRVVVATTQRDTLTAGKGLRVIAGTIEYWFPSGDQPAWLTEGQYVFDQAPLPEVLAAWEQQYGSTLAYDRSDRRRYTGAFPADDAELALDLILKPMGLQVESADTETIRLTLLPE